MDNLPEIYRQKITYGRIMLWAPNMIVSITGRFRGRISPEQMEAALRKAEIRHPLLRTRIYCEADGTAWFTNEAVNEPPLWILPREHEQDWIRLTLQEYPIPFPITTGPLTRYYLLHGEDISDLVIFTHHLIGDGLGMSNLFCEILSYLNNPDQGVIPLPSPPLVTAENLPSSVKENFFEKLYLWGINRFCKGRRVSIQEVDYIKLHQQYWEEKFGVLSFELSQEETKKIVALCKARKVSMQSCLCAAFLTAQADVQGSEQAYLRRMSMSVNLRERLIRSPESALGLYASGLFCNMHVSQDGHFTEGGKLSFWDQARAFHEQIKRELKNEKKLFQLVLLDKIDPLIQDALCLAYYRGVQSRLFNWIFDRMQIRGKMRGLEISNLGRIEIQPDQGKFTLETIISGAPLVLGVEKVAAIITAGGRMNITLVYRECDISPILMERIRDRTLAVLKEAAAGEYISQLESFPAKQEMEAAI